jgi:RNA polymerase sigma-70 factor (ECF subfamily)
MGVKPLEPQVSPVGETPAREAVSGVMPRIPPFDELYDEFFPIVWRTARRMGIPEAQLEDLCQDVFIAVHRRLPDFQGNASLKTWIFGFVVNVVQTHRRTLRRKSVDYRATGGLVDPDTLVDSRFRTPDSHVNCMEAIQVARRALEELSENKRIVLVLSEFEQLTAAEIAVTIGVNVNTVYARLRSARRQFSKAVKRLQLGTVQ